MFAMSRCAYMRVCVCVRVRACLSVVFIMMHVRTHTRACVFVSGGCK